MVTRHRYEAPGIVHACDGQACDLPERLRALGLAEIADRERPDSSWGPLYSTDEANAIAAAAAAHNDPCDRCGVVRRWEIREHGVLRCGECANEIGRD